MYPPLVDAPCPLSKGIGDASFIFSISVGDALSTKEKSIIEWMTMDENNPGVSAQIRIHKMINTFKFKKQ